MSAATDVFVLSGFLGALYVLIALGFTMIFSIGGIANLAHGAFLMLGGYFTFLLFGQGVPLGLSVTIGVVLVGVVAFLVYKVLFAPIEEHHLTALIVTLLVALIMEELVGIFVTREPRPIPSLLNGVLEILGTPISYNRLIAFAVSWASVVGVWYFVTRTQTGRAVLATSIDRKGAASLGINVNNMSYLVWGIAGSLGALAGYFWGSFTTLSPHMGFDPMLVGFVIVIIGGLGSIKGSIIGAYLVAFLESIAVVMIDPGAQGLFSFGALILFLIVKPEGLFGTREASFD